ncbi:MAG: tetratricopeptide repeat protein, partial [Bdellovibrionota bacterium]
MSWGTMFSRYDRNVTNLDSAVTRVLGRKVSTLNVLLLAALLSGNAFAYTQAEVNQVVTPQEARVDDFRNKEIQQLQVVLSRSAAREKQPDLLLRLAELYTEKYRLYFMKENEIWAKQMESYMALTLEQQKSRRRPVLENETSKQWLGKAVEVLERIPLQKESYERIDEVYYFLGFNQWELGKKKQAAEAFDNIVDKHPSSRFAPEAYRYLGDFAFANREFTKSRSYYEKAAKTNTPARPRVLYGLGWSLFKLHDYKGAVNTMREAITTGRNNSEAAKTGVALQRDAAESLALFYSEGGDVDKAVAYFNDLFEGESLPVLRKLAQNYQSQGKYAKALAINKQLLAMGGAAAKEGEEQRFGIMVDSLNVAITKGDRAKQAALLTAMTGEFVTNAKEPEAERLEILKTQVRKAATFAHREGNKAGNAKVAFQRAEDLYRLYLTAYAKYIKPEDAAEIRFYLTDVLSQLGKQREAAAEYKAMLDLSQTEPAYKKYAKDSAANIIFSLDAYFKQQKGEAKALSKSDGDQLIGAIDSYLQAYPNDKEAAKYLARAAGILITSGRADEAGPRLNDIIAKYPRSPEAWDAASTLIKQAGQSKDPDAKGTLAKTYLANAALMSQDKKGEFRKQLESIVSRTDFEKVAKTDESKDFGGAAQGYEKLADSSKDEEVRRVSLNNAAVAYAKLGDKANEIRIYKKILQRNPGNESAEKALLGIGNEYFLSGQYSEAADVFEGYYKMNEPKLTSIKPNSQKLAIESLRSSALLRRALRQNDKAAEDFKSIVEAANKGIGAARDAAG